MFLIFVTGLILKSRNKQKTHTIKATKSVAVVSKSARLVKPNLVGIITSIKPLKSGTETIIVNGISEAEYRNTRKTNLKLNPKNYLVLVTTKTKVTTGKTPKTLLATDDLKKGLKVSIYATKDLATALRIEVE